MAVDCYVCRAGKVGDMIEIGRISHFELQEGSQVALEVWRTEMRHKFEEMKMN